MNSMLLVTCKNAFDTQMLVSSLVGDDVTFVYHSETGDCFIPINSIEHSWEMQCRINDYDLDEEVRFLEFEVGNHAV